MISALLAGFIDAIVGGGGLIQLPVLFILFPSFSVPMAIGTNRFSSFMGTAVAAFQYLKKVKIPIKTTLLASFGAASMSFLGANLSYKVSQEILKPIILVLMICIAVYTYRKKALGLEEKLRFSLKILPFAGLIIGMSAGFYNGFVGPGTGSLLIFGFVSIIGFGFIRASAISKIVNFIGDISSLIFFLSKGFVIFKIGIPMMLCNILGSYIGSKTALKNGSAFVRKMFLVVVGLLLLRFGYDILKPFLI